MVQLYINDQLVALSEEQGFTFTKNNSLFTKDSSFTYDIKLSLKNTVNARIFGPVSHKSVNVNTKQYSALLIVDGRNMLNGYAKITSVEDDSINIQLIDRDNTKWKNLYIDELNIGRVINFQSLGYELRVDRIANAQDFSRWEGYSDPNDFIIEAHIEKTYGIDAASQTAQAAFEDEFQDEHYIGIHLSDMKAILQYRNYNFDREIYFSTVELANKRSESVTLANWMYPTSNGGRYKWIIHNTANNFIREYEMFAPQLKLYYVIEKVFEAVGYRVNYNFLKDDPLLKNIIVANATVTNILSHTLPHWTVEQFIKEIETFASVLFEFEGDVVNVKQMIKNHELNEDVTEISIIDKYTKKIEKDKEDINSLSYDLKLDEENAYDFLPKDIVDQCVFVECGNISDIDVLFAEPANQRCNVIFKTKDGSWYFKDETKNTRLINEFRDSSENGNVVKLGIKPVSLLKATIGGKGYMRIFAEGSIESYTNPNKTFCLSKYFKHETDKEEKNSKDALNVAIFEGISQPFVPIVYTSSSLLFTNYNIQSWDVRSSLSLWRDDSAVSRKRFDIAEYDEQTIYTFYFVSDVMPDVKSIFLIEGKKYFAKSITCEIKSDSISRFYKGEFLRILK